MHSVTDRILYVLAATAGVLHIVVNATTAYGYFRDEFYYLACSEHLAFGYVDHPPFSILLLALSRLVLGDSMVALRVLPAIAHAVVVFMTGRIARELGGNSFTQILAAVCALTAPQYLGMLNFYSMNAFDLLFWTTALLLVVRIVTTGNKKLWLWFGVVAGLGAQNKFSILFLCFGIGAGLLLTSARKELFSKEFWIGTAIAAVIFLPHLVWQYVHGFPTLEFIRNATLYKNVASSPLEFLTGQILMMSPLTLPVWGIGLLYFLFSSNGKRFRFLGLAYVIIFATFVLQRGKPYYLSPIYPILFAGGAVALEEFIQKRLWYRLRTTLVAMLVLGSLLSFPYALPILAPERFIAYANALGVHPQPDERHQMGKLPQHYADMFGWEEQVAAVARAFQTLTPEEQADCALVGDNYGRAGAIDFFGEKYGLPKAISRHNNYWLWGTRGYTGRVVIVIGGGFEDKKQLFDSVEVTETVQCEYCMPYENNLRVFVCRGIREPLETLWRQNPSFN